MKTLQIMVDDLESSANYSLILALVYIIENKFSRGSRSPLLIGQYAETKINEREQNQVVEEVLKITSETAEIRYVLEVENTQHSVYNYIDFGENLTDEEYFYQMDGRTDKAIWFVDSLNSFNSLEADLLDKRDEYNRNGFFCIVYTGNESDHMVFLRSTFRRLLGIYVINVNVLLNYRNELHAYTYFPYTKDKCYNSDPQLYALVEPSVTIGSSLTKFFPRKFSNMWGCNMTVTTWNEPPFVMFENNRIHGIEGLLITELSRIMNFTINIKTPPNLIRGSYFPNKTSTGAMKLLIENETNITILCLMYEKDRVKIADAVYPYMSVPLVLAIPKGRLMTPFERLKRPFRFKVWSCLSASILLAMLCIYSLKRFFTQRTRDFVFGYRNRTPITNLWAVLCGISLYKPIPRRNFARFLLALWMLYTWNLRSAYVTELFILLQDGRARSTVNTLAEALELNYTIFTYPALAPILEDSSKIPLEMLHVDSEKNSLSKLIHRVSRENAQISISLLEHILRSYNQQPENRQHPLFCVPEPIIQSPLTFYMPKHSFFTLEMNDLILKMMSAGVLKKFEDTYMIRKKFWQQQNQEPVMLSISLLFGVFSIYLSLILLSIFMFILELVSTRSKLVKNVLNFLNY